MRILIATTATVIIISLALIQSFSLPQDRPAESPGGLLSPVEVEEYHKQVQHQINIVHARYGLEPILEDGKYWSGTTKAHINAWSLMETEGALEQYPLWSDFNDFEEAYYE